MEDNFDCFHLQERNENNFLKRQMGTDLDLSIEKKIQENREVSFSLVFLAIRGRDSPDFEDIVDAESLLSISME